MKRLNRLNILSLSILSFGMSLTFSFPALAEPTIKIIGNCETESCETLWQTLVSNFPEKTQNYQQECLPPEILGLSVYSHSDQSKVVYLSCWEPTIENGERTGKPLGVLPFPGYEQQFGVEISSDNPEIQAILNRNIKTVENMSFECATQGGNINILVSENGSVTLQCYFQAGVSLVDVNGDGVSDGENSRGAGVDFTEELKN